MRKALGVAGGVVIKAITGKGALAKVRVQEGYVILKADGKEVKTVDEFRKILESAGSNVKVEGMYKGYEGIYPIVIPLNNAN